MIAYLELADYLLIAARVLGLPVEVVANFNRIGLAESALAVPPPKSRRPDGRRLLSFPD